MLSRDSEMSIVEQTLASAASGMGASLLIEADIGFGKSHLARAALRSARARGFEVLCARARQSEHNLPYGVLSQLRDQLPAHAEQLPAGPADAPGPTQSALATAEAVAVLVKQSVTALAARGPLLLVVDDLQWADAASLRWLGHFMAPLEGLPVALLATMSRDHIEPCGKQHDRAARVSLAAVASDFHQRVVLPGLNSESVGFLLSSRLGRPVGEDVVQASHRATGGSPALVQALLREILRSTNPADLSADQVAELGSSEVAETLIARFESWLPGVGRALSIIAVLSRVRSPRIVAELAGISIEEAADLLHTLTRCAVLDRSGDGTELSRPMLRASLLAAMPPSERSRLHAQAARALHDADASSEQVADHLLYAAPLDEPWACQLLIEAADTALASGEPAQARAYLERGLAEYGASTTPGLLRRLGHVELGADPASAAVRLRQTLHLTRQDAQWRATVLLDLVQAIVLTGDVNEALRTAKSEIGEFERAGADAGLRTGMQAMVGVLTLLADHVASLPPFAPDKPATSWGRRAQAALSALQAYLSGTQRERAVRYARLALAEPVENAGAQPLRLLLVLILCHAGEDEDAIDACQAILATAEGGNSPIIETLARTVLAECTLRSGCVRRAVRAAHEALGMHTASPENPWPSSPTGLGPAAARMCLGAALLESGRLHDAQALFDTIHLGATPEVLVPTLLLHRGRLRTALGRVEAGLADLEECGRQLRIRGWSNPAAYPWRSAAALAHGRLGHGVEAERLALEELALARCWGAPRPIGQALRVLGLLAHGDERIAFLTEAVRALRGCGAGLEEAHALRDLGRELLYAHKAKQAREHLRAALALAERSGADILLRELRQDLADSGAKPRRNSETGLGALTPAEHRTALLAADGLTNKEIANRLYVTQRTVEMHLSRVYRKLCIRDRRTLGTLISGQGAAARTARAALDRKAPASSDAMRFLKRVAEGCDLGIAPAYAWGVEG